MLSLITPTGCRPAAFAHCQRWMAAQDYTGPVEWIVVDDGEVMQPIEFTRWPVVVVRPQPYWQEGDNTLARNLLAGLEIAGDRVVIIEDDDYYAPGWLSAVDAAFDRAELVGQALSRYYHVGSTRSIDFGRQKHASLCATAVRGRAKDVLKEMCQQTSRGIDLKLWRRHEGQHLMDCELVTGIKGLPGRENIGMGRNLKGQATMVLENWIGEDAKYYVS